MSDEPQKPVTNLSTAPDFYADYALGCSFTAGNVRIPMISRRLLESDIYESVCVGNLVMPIETARDLAAAIDRAMQVLADTKAKMPEVPPTMQ